MPSPARSRIRIWILGFVLLGAAAALVRYFSGGDDADRAARGGSGPGFRRGGPNQVVPVRLVTAERRDIDVHLRALGTVTPLNTVTVRSRVDGELVRVLFGEGQHVGAGQLLAEIDPRPYEAQLAQALGQQAENVSLRPHEQRTRSAGAIIAALRERVADVPGISVYFQPVQDLTIEDRVSRTQRHLLAGPVRRRAGKRWGPGRPGTGSNS